MLQTFPIVIITVCTACCLMRLFIKIIENQMSHTFVAILKHCHWMVNVSVLQCLNYILLLYDVLAYIQDSNNEKKICYSLIEKSVRYLNMKIISISTMLNIENCKKLIASCARIEKNEQELSETKSSAICVLLFFFFILNGTSHSLCDLNHVDNYPKKYAYFNSSWWAR